MKERIQGHLHLIRSNDVYNSVPVHFNGNGHTEQHLKVVGIEKVNREGVIYRRERESYYIKKYGTINQLNRKGL